MRLCALLVLVLFFGLPCRGASRYQRCPLQTGESPEDHDRKLNPPNPSMSCVVGVVQRLQ